MLFFGTDDKESLGMPGLVNNVIFSAMDVIMEIYFVISALNSAVESFICDVKSGFWLYLFAGV